MTRRRLPLVLAGAFVLAAGVTACGDDASPTVTGDIGDAPADRVLVLGEEPLLADLLALGVTPAASTASVGRRFRGVEGARDVEALPAGAGIEDIREVEPDLIVASGEAADDIGIDRLEEVASTAVVDGADWRAAFADLARELGAGDRAAPVLDAYDAAVAGARRKLTGRNASLVTVVAEDEFRVWVSGPEPVPATFVDAGVALRPAADAHPEAESGRVTVGPAGLAGLAGEAVVLVQSDGLDADAEAVEAVQESQGWKAIPAVAARRVVTIDRLDYPGVTGRTRLAAELPELLASPPQA